MLLCYYQVDTEVPFPQLVSIDTKGELLIISECGWEFYFLTAPPLMPSLLEGVGASHYCSLHELHIAMDIWVASLSLNGGESSYSILFSLIVSQHRG